MIGQFISKIYRSLVYKGEYQKAYYVVEFLYFLMQIRRKIINKKLLLDIFWLDQSSDSIKENINKQNKFEEKRENIDPFSNDIGGVIKNKKVYLISDQFQGTGPGILHDIARNYFNTSKQAGINLKNYYTDDFQFEVDSISLENEIRAFNPDYLIVVDHWWQFGDDPDAEKKLSFLRQIKDKLGMKLIIYLCDAHYLAAGNKLRNFIDIADKMVSLSSWSPIFSLEEFKSKLCHNEYFTDENLFFPKSKKIDLFFAGVDQADRAEIITFAAHISNKLKLKTKLSLRGGRDYKNNSVKVKANKIMGDGDYREFLQVSRAAINISMKGTVLNGKRVHIINGRVPEIMSSGAALIQYKPKADSTLTLDNYYIPWKEYLPFSSRKELKEIIYLLKYESDIISEIAHNGREKYLECYNSSKSWERILKFPFKT